MSKKNKSVSGLQANIQTIKQPTRSFWSDFAADLFRKYETVIILFLFCIALVIRLYRINYLNFWVDEFVHVNRSMDFLRDFKFSHIFGGEKNGILVTILNIAGFALFGKNEFGGRFFIAIISAGLIPATYFFCKKIFNNYIGLMSCLFILFSQYLVFWARMDRQYGPIPTFYILLILGVVSLLQYKEAGVENNTFWSKYNLNKKWIGWTLLFLFLSLITNLETYFIIFSSGLYAIYLWAEQGLFTKKWFMVSGLKLAIVSLLAIMFFILTFSPLNKIIMRPLFLHIMPEGMVSLIIPDWAYIKSKLISADKFKYFKVYWGVITADLPYTVYFCFVGLLTMAVVDLKKFMMIFSYYIFPFLLMSFVFLDPCLPRYH
ncbi:MAG: glycosyltransferase family 39 protein, partial [Saprospiraceae bacterium]